MCKFVKMDKYFIICIEIMKLIWFGILFIFVFIFTFIMGWFILDIFMLFIVGIFILLLLEIEVGVFLNTFNKLLFVVFEFEELVVVGLNWEKFVKLLFLEL